MAFIHVEPPCIFLVWSVNVHEIFVLCLEVFRSFCYINSCKLKRSLYLLEAQDRQKEGNLWILVVKI